MMKYMTARYKDGARGETENGVLLYDCWGLARAARHELYGKPLLASRAGEYLHDKRGMTRHYSEQASEMKETFNPDAGSVIAVLSHSGLCVHVAMLAADDKVLEMTPKSGVRLIPLRRFLAENSHRVIKFYDDPDISQ